jgi:nucleoside-diphosphate-sugar epimerase
VSAPPPARPEARDGAPPPAQRPVLVTGASGFLGRHLARRLEAGGLQVVRAGRRQVLAEAPGESPGERWLQLDLADPDRFESVVRELRPSVVYHLAGFASGGTGLDAIERAFELNARATARLLLAIARAVPDARVVHTGTLDASAPDGVAPLSFGTPYGASKLMSELAIRTMREFAALDVVSARVGNAYGPDEPNPQRFVPYAIGELAAGRSPRVSSGTRRADFVHVADVAEALARIGGHPGPLPSPLDVGTGTLSSIREVVETIARLLGATQPIAWGAAPERRGDQSPADAAALEAAIGWRPAIGLEDGLRDTVGWYLRGR